MRRFSGFDFVVIEFSYLAYDFKCEVSNSGFGFTEETIMTLDFDYDFKHIEVFTA